MPFFPKNQ